MISCMSLTYFLDDLEMVPVAPIITGITLVFTFHMRCIFIVRSLYFKIFSAFLITFLSPEIATSINMHVPFSLSRIIMSGLLLGYYYYYYSILVYLRAVSAAQWPTVGELILWFLTTRRPHSVTWLQLSGFSYPQTRTRTKVKISLSPLLSERHVNN